jgi:NADH dehydrogenase FAD-containing subunit
MGSGASAALQSQKVVVVGGGYGGVQVAAALDKYFDVTLIEKREVSGSKTEVSR